MEEIINLDGRQFKLSADRPLTALEREQAIADIKKQTGCKTCGPRTMANMGIDNDWQYGGISGLDFGVNTSGCTGTSKTMGESVGLSARPTGGTEPYTVNFWVKFGTHAPTQSTTGISTPYHDGVLEAETVTASYTVLEADMVPSLRGDTTVQWVSGVDLSTVTGAPLLAGGTHALADGNIRFYSTVIDSCPGGTPKTCANECDVAITCTAPTCNFVVT